MFSLQVWSRIGRFSAVWEEDLSEIGFSSFLLDFDACAVDRL